MQSPRIRTQKPSRSIRAAVEQLEQRQLLANIQLAAELYAGTWPAAIDEIVELNGKLYVDSRGDLFATSGTQSSTSLIKTFGYVTTDELIATSTTLFMRVSGSQLWASNGTTAGTVNITPAALASDAGSHFAFGSRLFFAGKNVGGTITPWISDGTAGGTTELVNAPLVTSIDPVVMGGQLFFVAGTSSAYKVYRSDGTPGGTQAIFSIPTLFANDLAAVGDKLVLSLPSQQWAVQADGSATQIGSIFDADDLTTWNGVVYFSGSRGGIGSEGWELWRSDGTSAGTYILKDIDPTSSSSPSHFAVAQTRLYFIASTQAQGAEWWLTDGTSQGTRLAGELFPGTGGLNTSSVTADGYAVVGDTLFFENSITGYGQELCQTDGTQAGTRMVENLRGTGAEEWIGSWPSTIRSFGPAVYFEASNDTLSHQLFKYSPSDEGLLTGSVFADADYDGTRDVGEGGIAGITVYLDANNNSTFDAGEANGLAGGDGSYRFAVPAGALNVRAVLPAGMGQSTSFSSSAISSGELRSGLFIGLYVNTPPVVTPPTTYSVDEGQSRLLTATASDAQTPIARVEWDLNYDGTFDITNTGASASFDATAIDGPATRQIAVRVFDPAGAVSEIATSTVEITNASPTATLSVPTRVALGAPAAISLTNPWDSAPVDRPTLSYSFDYNDDGVFEVVDSASATAQIPAGYLTTAGTHWVRAAIKDDDEGVSTYRKALSVCAISLSTLQIPELTAADSAVATISVVGAAGASFTYTLVDGEGANDNAAFRIQGNQLYIRATPDFEIKSTYAIRLRATSGGITAESTLNLSVTNVNEAPSVSFSPGGLAENAGASAFAGVLSVTDQDADDTATFSLVAGDGDDDNARFEIVGNELRAKASLDFEQASVYSIRVAATDAGGLVVEKVFTITVTDVNERPTSLSLSNARIAEGAASGSLIGNLSSSDPDADAITYSLVSGTGSADNASFQIVSGQLRTRAAFDYETKSSYSIRVRATDAGGLYYERAFAIAITNASEIPVTVNGTAGNDTISLTTSGSKLSAVLNGATLWQRELALVGSIQVSGMDGDDRITIPSSLKASTLLYGGNGNDTITGGAGNDTIYGNFGDDVVIGGAGNDSVMAGIGADSITGDAGNDSIWGGDQSDTIRGGDGNDYIEGKGKADSLYGDAGNDTILGQAGSDLIYGGIGDDRVYVLDPVGTAFRDTVYAGAGQDGVSYDIMDRVLENELDIPELPLAM